MRLHLQGMDGIELIIREALKEQSADSASSALLQGVTIAGLPQPGLAAPRGLKCALARARRDITVPIGSAETSAICR